MANHIVKITLNDEEETFIKWLAKYDGITVKEELKQLLNLQIWEEMQVHEKEAKAGL